MKKKTPQQSLTILTNLVLPGESNHLNSLFGGELLARMDRAAAIAANRHSQKTVVTVSVHHVTFKKTVPVGSILSIEAKVSHAFRTSMEVYVEAFIDDKEQKIKVSDGIFNFVAVDSNGNPTQILPITPETKVEKERYHDAVRRRELNLVFAGKLDAKDAHELKKMFF